MPDFPKDQEARVSNKEILLVSTNDAVETEMLEARLKSAGIPFYTKAHGDKGIMKIFMGLSVYGADIFVPSDRLEKAKEIIQRENDPSAVWNSESHAPAADDVPDFSKERNTPLWQKLLIGLVIVLLLLSYFAFNGLIEYIRTLFGY